ncbi:MAG: hypothetical protein ACOYNZ_03525, partial [Rhodoferax sp.]
ASGQVGFGLYGDSGTSWSATTGGKFWVSRNIALSGNLWYLDSWRDNAAYNSLAATLNLEVLWR